MIITFFRHSLLNRGGDQVIIEYANDLASRGHKCVILTNEIKTIFPISPEVAIKRIPWSGKLGSLLYALWGGIDADVIVADIIVMAVILRLRFGRKVIYLAQDYDIYYYPDPVRRLLIRCLYFIGLRIFSMPTIAVSESLKTELSRFGSDITVLTNSIDPNCFYSDPDERLLAGKEDRTVVLCLGRLEFRKGFDLTYKIFATLQSRINKDALEIWIIGEDLSLSDVDFRVKKFGYLPPQKLRKILSSADILLYPTRHEGFGLLPLEAMACGCLVVTTQAVAFAAHMKNAWVTPVNDIDGLTEGIVLLIKNPQERSRLKKNAMRTAAEFNRDKLKPKLEDCFQKLFSSALII